jgi:hypothetical protein
LPLIRPGSSLCSRAFGRKQRRVFYFIAFAWAGTNLRFNQRSAHCRAFPRRVGQQIAFAGNAQQFTPNVNVVLL